MGKGQRACGGLPNVSGCTCADGGTKILMSKYWNIFKNFMQERKSETTAFEVTIGSSLVHVKTEIVGKPLTGTTRKIIDQAML